MGVDGMVGGRHAAVVVGSALLLVLSGCASDEANVHGDDLCPPGGCPDESIEDDHEFPPLTQKQLKRYYEAQLAWRACAMGQGLALPEPPTFEEYAADPGTWSVSADISDEEWNRLIVGTGGSGNVGARCGEPPGPHDFLVSDDAFRRLYAWQERVVACLEGEGFPLETTAPPIEEFVESGGTNWVPAREFHGTYGFLEGETWERVYTRCGNDNQDLWLDASDFEDHRPALRARYEENLALAACLEGAGFQVPAAPPIEEFIEELGENWSSADIWEAVYRDNERKAVQAFADTMDQVCPGVS